METYMDDAFVVTNNTVISYVGRHATLKIPGHFAGMELSRIGDGSFMESTWLQRVILPPQVKQIGRQAFYEGFALSGIVVPGGLREVEENAFSRCPSLSEITIYDLELSPSEYYSLKNGGNKSHEGVYVLRQMPDHALVGKLICAIGDVKPAHYVPDGISFLFHQRELDDQKGKVSLDKSLPVIGFDMGSFPVSENNAFSRHIKKGKAEHYDAKAEQKNDWHVRVGKYPAKEKTVIFTFDDSQTKEENGKYLISATLKIGYFFWQSAQPVICEQKKYYVYRRLYLNADPEMSYVRRDIAVYTDKGLVKDREEAQNVYAKYKLLSIL